MSRLIRSNDSLRQVLASSAALRGVPQCHPLLRRRRQPHNGGYPTETALIERGLVSAERLQYVYYSESDQILRVASIDLLRAISAASNASCLFVPQRREKGKHSIAAEYMGSLSGGRVCGLRGTYALVMQQQRRTASVQRLQRT